MLFSLVEFIFSIFVFISLSANLWYPEKMEAATGVSKILSYQGRLTDASGNPLGGTGTNYCFRFSVYDNATVGAGSKLWPAGTPSTMTINVANGVFNVGIGDTGAGGDDLAAFNFYDNDSIYLNVETAAQVAESCSGVSFENLSPRQRIEAVGYSLSTRDVYGDLLRTLNSTGIVQIGTGTGVASNQKLFRLDVKNTSDTIGGACTTSGALWYNSSSSRALVCDGTTIQEIGNLGTIVGIKEQSTTTNISSGTVNFSGSNNITISQEGQTLKFSVPSPIAAFGLSNIGNTIGNTGVQTGTFVLSGQANITLSQITGAGGIHTIGISAPNPGAGGGGFAIPDFVNFDRAYIINVTNMTATGVTQRPIFIPFVLPGSLTWNQGFIEVSRATSGSNMFTGDWGIYSYVNSTQLTLLGSLRNTYSNSNTASISGIRRIAFTGMGAGATTLNPGPYVMGMMFSASAGTASMNYSLRGAVVTPPVGNVYPGANSNPNASSVLTSLYLQKFLGRYTTTSGNLPNSVGFNHVQQYTSMMPIYFHLLST